MSHYKNFKTVVYIPAQVAASFDRDHLEQEYRFLEKYVGLDKVYLETARGECLVGRDQMIMVRDTLRSLGVEVSGGITTTTPDLEEADKYKQRLFGTYCYSNAAMRAKLRSIAEFTAELFDEIILDDFFFTNCTCEECIKAKGDRTWTDFRRDLMTEVSQNLVLGPAKAVNPDVKVTIKYPNWRESFHLAGYVPETEISMFDRIYTGTETRSPRYTDQHLPEYLSYALMRWTENALPGRNGGGWLDVYQCWSIDRYMEQAYLTAFSGAREIMLFQWHHLINNPLVTPMGLMLGYIDKTLSGIGKPVGVKTYIPFASDGENHVEMRLGMQGIPIEMTPYFPEDGSLVLLTEASHKDPQIMERLRSHLLSGAKAVVTSGFAAKADPVKWAELSELHLTGRINTVTRYMNTDDDADHQEHVRPILFPDIQHGNNASWSLLNGGDQDYHSTLFMRSPYGKGKLYTLVIPENASDLKYIPAKAYDQVKKVLNTGGLYITASNVSLFQYDDDSFILYRYVKDEIHPVQVTVHLQHPAQSLVDLMDGSTYPFRKIEGVYDKDPFEEYITEVVMEPGRYRTFKIV